MRKNLPQTRSWRRAALLMGGYLAIQWASSLIFITLITFIFLNSKDSIPKIADFFYSNKLLNYSISAIIFVTILRSLRPLSITGFSSVFGTNPEHTSYLTKSQVKQSSWRGFVLAFAFVLISLIAGHLSWLGFYMRFDEVAISIGTSIIFSLGFSFLVIFEEYLMRRIVEPQLRRFGGPRVIMGLSSLTYLGIKAFQFDLNLISAVNFALLNLVFSLIARKDRSHLSSAAFACLFYVTLHTIFAQPFMGQDMPGIFILRAIENDSKLNNLISGGMQGPENSLILTVLLAVYFILPKIVKKGEKRK